VEKPRKRARPGISRGRSAPDVGRRPADPGAGATCGRWLGAGEAGVAHGREQPADRAAERVAPGQLLQALHVGGGRRGRGDVEPGGDGTTTRMRPGTRRRPPARRRRGPAGGRARRPGRPSWGSRGPGGRRSSPPRPRPRAARRRGRRAGSRSPPSGRRCRSSGMTGTGSGITPCSHPPHSHTGNQGYRAETPNQMLRFRPLVIGLLSQHSKRGQTCRQLLPSDRNSEKHFGGSSEKVHVQKCHVEESLLAHGNDRNGYRSCSQELVARVPNSVGRSPLTRLLRQTRAFGPDPGLNVPKDQPSLYLDGATNLS
jgi:hypothetical protein